MATFSWVPDFGYDTDYTPRSRSANFGGGYSQVSGDGINPFNNQWSLTFGLRNQAERDGIINFLKPKGDWEIFDWVTPNGDTIKVRCLKFKDSQPSFGNFTITATFKQEYVP